LPVAGAITAVLAFAILALEQHGYRPFELAITALFAIVFLGFAYDLARVHVDPRGIASGLTLSPPRRGFARLVRADRGAGKTTALGPAATAFAEEHGAAATILSTGCVAVPLARPYESVLALLAGLGESPRTRDR